MLNAQKTPHHLRCPLQVHNKIPDDHWEYQMRKQLNDACYQGLDYVPFCSTMPVQKKCDDPKFVWVSAAAIVVEGRGALRPCVRAAARRAGGGAASGQRRGAHQVLWHAIRPSSRVGFIKGCLSLTYCSAAEEEEVGGESVDSLGRADTAQQAALVAAWQPPADGDGLAERQPPAEVAVA